MKLKILSMLLLVPVLCLQSEEPTVYGKLWISVESQDTASGTEVDMVSNASRLGIKGSMDFGEGIEAIYQAEYEVDPVDGTADESKDRTFKQRNSFVGLKGSMDTIFLGKHDTATKKSQKKIDLFNDLAGDIKNILQGENRMSDLVGYTTPKINGCSATFNEIKGTEGLGDDSIGDSTSTSLSYDSEKIYIALAFDSELKGYDSTRLTLQIPFSRSQLGIMFQESEKLSTGKIFFDYVGGANDPKKTHSITLAGSKKEMGTRGGKLPSYFIDLVNEAVYNIRFEGVDAAPIDPGALNLLC